jgi:hypothetical protein
MRSRVACERDPVAAATRLGPLLRVVADLFFVDFFCNASILRGVPRAAHRFWASTVRVATVVEFQRMFN